MIGRERLRRGAALLNGLEKQDADTLYPEMLLSEYGIIIVEGFDSESVIQYLQNNLSTNGKVIHKFDDEMILLRQQVIRIIN